jgi:tetratricopeptide (TPR) repeat protein
MIEEDPRILSQRAHALRMQGSFSEAREHSLRATRIDRRYAPAWFNLGASLAGLHEHQSAIEAYREALRLQPAYAEAWSNLGGVLEALGRIDEAIGAYRNGIAANDALAPIWSNLGNALLKAGKTEEAVSVCRQATKLAPAFAPAWVNLGNALRASSQPLDAAAAFRKAIELSAHLAEAWVGLGNALEDTDDLKGALAAFERACLLKPGMAEAQLNLGLLYKHHGRLEEAVACYRRALAINPQRHDTRWSLALVLLALGRFDEGWSLYESRWLRRGAPRRRFATSSRDLATARNILVWSEQGIGDEVLYASIVPEIVSSGSKVTFEVDPRLLSLFMRSLPDVSVVARKDPPGIDAEQFDAVMPSGSLGAWRRRSFASFPRHSGFLKADPQRREMLMRELRRDGEGPVVGISWRSQNPEVGRRKTLALDAWQAILGTPGIRFVNLQYGDTAGEIAALQHAIGIRLITIEHLDLFNDIEGLAALVACCDLVITTSNVNAHIAGALGREVWLLLPRHRGRLWYWFVERADSPWYPSMQIFSQTEDGDWDPVIAEVAAEVRRRFKL